MSTDSTCRAGLQSLALALIFMPEPVSTVVGLGLLAASRAIGTSRPHNFHRLSNGISDHFDYRLTMKGNSTIAVEFKPKRHGQLPRAYPRIARLQDNPEALKSLQQKAKLELNRRSTTSSALEPAGLLKPPVRLHPRLPTTTLTVPPITGRAHAGAAMPKKGASSRL